MAFDLSSNLMSAQAMGESGGNPNIGQHGGLSTAGGMFGFTTPTWQGMMNNHPELGLTMAGKNDPGQQQRAYPVFASDNASSLQRSGVNPTASLVSLASFLGPTAAAAFGHAQPGERSQDVLTRALGADQANQFMRSNPTILTASATVGDVIAHNDKTHVNSNGRDLGETAAPQSGFSPSPASPGASAAPMPADFAQGPSGNSPRASVDTSGQTGDTMISTGLALMGGRDWREGLANAGHAYEAASARSQAVAMRNAELQNDGIKRDTDAPYRAAEVAQARAAAWNASQAPTTLTAAQAATLQQSNNQMDLTRQHYAETAAFNRSQLQQHGDQFQQSQESADRRFDETARTSENFIVPGEAPGQEQSIQVTRMRNGATEIKNMNTGETVPTMPNGAVPMSTYNAGQTQQARMGAKADALVGGLLNDAQAGQSRVADIDRAISSANAPGANTGPDMASRFARAIFPSLGIDVSEQDMAKMSIAGVGQAISAAAAKGQGAVSDSERILFAKLAPQMDTSPAARNQIFGVLRDIAARPGLVGQAWMAASPAEKSAAKASQASMAEWKYAATNRVIADQEKAHAPTQGAAALTNRPPLSSFRTGQPTPTGGTNGAEPAINSIP